MTENAKNKIRALNDGSVYTAYTAMSCLSSQISTLFHNEVITEEQYEEESLRVFTILMLLQQCTDNSELQEAIQKELDEICPNSEDIEIKFGEECCSDKKDFS